MFRTCIVLAALVCGAPALAERAVLECTADTWIAPGETTAHGGESSLDLRRNGAVLLDFRMAAVQGWRIVKATLLLHVASGAVPGRLRVAPVATPWNEAGAAWGLKLPAGGAQRRPRRYDGEWIEIDLAPSDLGPAGIAILGGSARFSSRESVSHAPYLLVEGSR